MFRTCNSSSRRQRTSTRLLPPLPASIAKPPRCWPSDSRCGCCAPMKAAWRLRSMIRNRCWHWRWSASNAPAARFTTTCCWRSTLQRPNSSWRTATDFDGQRVDLVDVTSRWLRDYPIVSIEDPLAEEDWSGWRKLASRAGDALLVGDDLLCTQVERIKRARALACANALLLKPNQVGSLTEALAALRAARDAGWTIVVSARERGHGGRLARRPCRRVGRGACEDWIDYPV